MSGLLATLFVGQSVSASNPSTFQFSFVATATTSTGASIIAGDKFFVEVVLDLDTASTASTPSYANLFLNSLASFTLTTLPSNTGTWSSQGVVWTTSPVQNFITNANGDTFTLQIESPAVPAINGVPFNDVVINLDWNPWDLDMVWQAGSTTLANKFGTRTPDITAASLSFELRNTSLNSETFTISQRTVGPTTTTTTVPVGGSTTPEALPPSTVTYVPSNRKATIKWNAVSNASSYVVATSSGQQVCASFSTSCVLSGLSNGKQYTYFVYSVNTSGAVSSSGTKVSVVPGFTVKSSTLRAKKSKLLSTLITSPSKGTKTWQISSGACKIANNRIIAPARSSTCRVKLSIAKWGSYASMATTVKVIVTQ